MVIVIIITLEGFFYWVCVNQVKSKSKANQTYLLLAKY